MAGSALAVNAAGSLARELNCGCASSSSEPEPRWDQAQLTPLNYMWTKAIGCQWFNVVHCHAPQQNDDAATTGAVRADCRGCDVKQRRGGQHSEHPRGLVVLALSDLP